MPKNSSSDQQRPMRQNGTLHAAACTLLQQIADDELAGDACCGCLVANTALELGGRDRTVNGLLQEHFATLETALTALMRRGQQQGEIAAGKSPVALARFLVATIQGLRVLGRGYEGEEQAQRLRDVIEVALGSL